MVCLSFPQMDNLNYFEIRANDAEEYGQFMQQNYLDVYKELQEEKEITRRLEDSNKKKSLLMEYQDAQVVFWKGENLANTKRFTKELKTANQKTTISIVCGSVVIGILGTLYLLK